MFPKRVRLGLSLVVVLQACLLLGLALARYAHVHNRTFDLALYARIAWGLAHGSLWSPVLGTHVLGSHLSPVLVPLGLLGRVLGTVPVLLATQALCIALTAWPLARIGARRLGTRGIWLALAAFLLYPNLFHVGTYEFHPGTLALLPMTWSFDALDRGNLRQLVFCTLGTLACREDLGAFSLLLGLVYYLEHRDRRALYTSCGAALYTVAAVLITSAHAPAHGSLDLHFGVWGGSPLGVLSALVDDPARVWAHFRAPERLHYLPRVLAPLSFFSLRAPKLLLPALPYLALNLLSAFPTADEQYSHYLTPALPALLVSGLVGVTAVRKRFLQALWLVTLGIAHVALGGSPLSIDFDRTAFVADRQSEAGARVLAAIPEGASVQAPDALLPHLAERRDVRRAPPPESGASFVVLDVRHRLAYAGREVLLRTTEEPLVRRFLAREDHALIAYEPPYALFARGREARREGVSRACLTAPRGPVSAPTTPLTRCLAVEDATLADRLLILTLRAQAPCAADLALRLGPDPMPARVALLCEGKLSPARLRAGDRVTSVHELSAREAEALRARGLWVGALRASGAPPEPGDAAASKIDLDQALVPTPLEKTTP